MLSLLRLVAAWVSERSSHPQSRDVVQWLPYAWTGNARCKSLLYRSAEGACWRGPRLADALGGFLRGSAGQYLRQDPDAADVQVLTKACIWGNNLYNAGKGKILEQARPGPAGLGHTPTFGSQ